MVLRSPMKISSRLLPAVQIDTSWVSLEFQHRRTPDGRVQANFYIDTDGWTYEGEGLCSGVGATPTAAEMMETLLAFLGSAAETYQYDNLRGRESDEDPLFPPHVMEWAYMHEYEIEMTRLDLENQEEVEE